MWFAIAQINKFRFKYCMLVSPIITLCYEYQFSFMLKVEVIAITNVLQVDLALKKKLRGTQKWSISKAVL